MKERLGQGRESRPVYEGEIEAGKGEQAPISRRDWGREGRAGLCMKERLGQGRESRSVYQGEIGAGKGEQACV